MTGIDLTLFRPKHRTPAGRRVLVARRGNTLAPSCWDGPTVDVARLAARVAGAEKLRRKKKK